MVMMMKQFVTFTLTLCLFLWMPTLTMKKDLQGMANTIVELVELVEEYQGNNDLEEKIIATYIIVNNDFFVDDFQEDSLSIFSKMAFEVLTPPPDLA